MDWLGIVSLIIGLVTLSILIIDVVGTVLVSSGGPGPIAKRTYRIVWPVWRKLAGSFGTNSKKRRFLSKGEAVLMVLTVVTWLALLIVSFALLFMPFIDQFALSHDSSVTNPFALLYVSAYSATTLGVGDIYPTSELLRMLLTIEAALGFSMITAAISYLISTNSAIMTSSSTALAISEFVDADKKTGGGSARVIQKIIHSESETAFLSWLNLTSEAISKVVRSTEQYPLSQYSHSPTNASAVPLAIEHHLELLTIIKTVLDPNKYSFVAAPQVESSYKIALKYLTTTYGTAHAHTSRMRERIDAKRSDEFENAYQALERADVQTRAENEAREVYIESRKQWDSDIKAVQMYMAYPVKT